MKVAETLLNDYYHKFITIEADDLTDLLKDEIEVEEDDCFALCSAYCGRDGLLEFNVLSIGPSWERCTKGLDNNKMLGIFTIDQVFDCECRIPNSDARMIEKNTPYIEEMDEGWDEDLLSTRLDARLDDLRDLFYPDVVLTGIILENHLTEYMMRITGVKGPFLVGKLYEEPNEDIGLHYDDTIFSLAYSMNNECHLFALFAGENLSEDEIEVRDRIIQEMDKAGIRFNGISFKN